MKYLEHRYRINKVQIRINVLFFKPNGRVGATRLPDHFIVYLSIRNRLLRSVGHINPRQV